MFPVTMFVTEGLRRLRQTLAVRDYHLNANS